MTDSNGIAGGVGACPFCGGKAEIKALGHATWAVQCASAACGAWGSTQAYCDQAIAAWNTRRTAPAEVDARVEAMANFGAMIFDDLWDAFTDGRWEIEVNDLITVSAQRAGLVTATDFDPDEHDDPQGACEPGDEFYMISPLGRIALQRARTILSAQPTGGQ